MSSRVTFSNKDMADHSSDSKLFSVRVKTDVCHKADFIKSIYADLCPPFEAGGNWDALNDIFCSMEWIKAKTVRIIHTKLPSLADEDLRTYLKILSNAVEHWKANNEIEFDVVFPISQKSIIDKILQ